MALVPSARGRGRRPPVADINVTPLVDVMLVLLVIFMVTAPMLTAGVPVDLPNSRAKPLDQAPDPVEITLDRQGKLFLGGKPLDPSAFTRTLSPIAKASDHGQAPQVMLHADRSLDYGRVMQLMGELNHIGLTRIALITEAAEQR